MDKLIAAALLTLPPAAFDIPPLRYEAQPMPRHVVWHVPLERVQTLCRRGPTIAACVLLMPDDLCIILLPQELASSTPLHAALLSHERAHCKGWPAEHPR